MRRHGWSGHALIESLHTAQESFGFLDDQALRYVAAGLRVPLIFETAVMPSSAPRGKQKMKIDCAGPASAKALAARGRTRDWVHAASNVGLALNDTQIETLDL